MFDQSERGRGSFLVVLECLVFAGSGQTDLFDNHSQPVRLADCFQSMHMSQILIFKFCLSVKCSICKSVSDTYDPYLDIAVEIRVRFIICVMYKKILFVRNISFFKLKY